MENKLITLEAPELVSIEKSKAAEIKAYFEPMTTMLVSFETSYNEIISESKKEITEQTVAKAKRLRLDISAVRVATEKERKKQKEEFLRAGKAIDGVSNILKYAVVDKENTLKEIENHYKIKEAKRLVDLQKERVLVLSEYIDDAESRDLAKLEDDEFAALVAIKKADYFDLIRAKEKAQKEREEAEQKERERIAQVEAENKKLKIEAEARQKLEDERKQKEAAELKARKDIEHAEQLERLAVEVAERKARQKLEDDRRAIEDAERKKILAKEEASRKQKEESERKARLIKEEAERKERLLNEEVERKALELKQKAEAEQRAAEALKRKTFEDAERAKQEFLSKNDSEKVKDLILDLTDIQKKYEFTSDDNKKMFTDVQSLLTKVVIHITGDLSK